MRVTRLEVEGRPNRHAPSLTAIEEALAALATPTGPTWIVLNRTDHDYIQAAGTLDRYVLESRDCWGEGFCHWRASPKGRALGEKTVLHYKMTCPIKLHAPRQCPLETHAACVLGLDDVRHAFLAYAADCRRVATFDWHVVTREYPVTKPADDAPIRDIRPRG
jgi:hypothetical protein